MKGMRLTFKKNLNLDRDLPDNNVINRFYSKRDFFKYIYYRISNFTFALVIFINVLCVNFVSNFIYSLRWILQKATYISNISRPTHEKKN